MDRARGRLAVISGHLVAVDVVNISSFLKFSAVISEPIAQQVAKLGGILRVVDERSGKEYKIVTRDDGTVMASDFKQIRYGNNKWLKLYDPGYVNTAPTHSSICYIDGEEGILRYRGYPIQDLAYGSTFTEVAYLLIYGCLPTPNKLEGWNDSISKFSTIDDDVLNIIEAAPKTAHPMCVLLTAITELSVLCPDAKPTIKGHGPYNLKKERDEQIIQILRMVPTIVATIYSVLQGKRYVHPSKSFSYTQNLLYMLDSKGNTSYRPNPKIVQILDILFILHAEHEMNCSTAAARHLASSGVNVFAVLAGALGAFYGPLHGGANEGTFKMLREIRDVKYIPQFIKDVANGKRKLSGFGHRVYKIKDPRLDIVHKLIKEASTELAYVKELEIAIELEKAAQEDAYFIEKNLYPNVHFYSAILHRVMALEERFFTMVFAVPRVAGLLAHWLESLDDPETKIIRPQQVYSGESLKRYVPNKEPNELQKKLLAEFKPSKASLFMKKVLTRPNLFTAKL